MSTSSPPISRPSGSNAFGRCVSGKDISKAIVSARRSCRSHRARPAAEAAAGRSRWRQLGKGRRHDAATMSARETAGGRRAARRHRLEEAIAAARGDARRGARAEEAMGGGSGGRGRRAVGWEGKAGAAEPSRDRRGVAPSLRSALHAPPALPLLPCRRSDSSIRPTPPLCRGRSHLPPSLSARKRTWHVVARSARYREPARCPIAGRGEGVAGACWSGARAWRAAARGVSRNRERGRPGRGEGAWRSLAGRRAVRVRMGKGFGGEGTTRARRGGWGGRGVDEAGAL